MFHRSTCVDAMSLLRLRNGPLSENGAFWSNVTGKMFVCPRAVEERVVETARRIVEPHLGPPRRRHRGVQVELRVHELDTICRTRPEPTSCRRRSDPTRCRRAARDCPTVCPCRPWTGTRRRPGSTGPAGRLRKDDAVDVLVEPSLVELIHGAVHELLREERLPAQTVVQRHPRTEAPRVLRVEPEVGLLHVQGVRGRLNAARSRPSGPAGNRLSGRPVCVPSIASWPGERTFASDSERPTAPR